MDLKNKVILITGATDGIGKGTAKKAAEKGAQIIIHGRDEERIVNTLKEIRQINESVFGIQADFSDLKQVADAAKEINENFEKIDILFNNAAEFIPEKQITKDGFERTFQVNYLAHVLLTEKLISKIKDTEGSRILNVTSMIHSSDADFENLQGEKNYEGSSAYSLSKLLNILHAYKLGRIYENNKVCINCLHPGVIETKLLNAAWSGGMPVSEGAETMLYAAETEATNEISGWYLENRRPMQSNPISYDLEIQDKLYDLSIEMLKPFL
ncbi:MAG: SDR family oxidoreductase [Bacteroidales bacterium]|nr:SDR family oxidoreductase [Bacteroidales bacterium]